MSGWFMLPETVSQGPPLGGPRVPVLRPVGEVSGLWEMIGLPVSTASSPLFASPLPQTCNHCFRNIRSLAKVTDSPVHICNNLFVFGNSALLFSTAVFGLGPRSFSSMERRLLKSPSSMQSLPLTFSSLAALTH